MSLGRWNSFSITALAATSLLGFGVQAKESKKASTEQIECKDGTISASSGRGACSGHGGILKASARAADSSEAKSTAGAMKSETAAKGETDNAVVCKDGTSSKAGRGACSGHGGVATSQVGRAAPAAPRTDQPPAGRARGLDPTTEQPVPVPGSAQSTTSGASSAKSPASSAPVTAPAAGTHTAKCKDGTFSDAKHHEGACSQHGGVVQWLDGK